MKKTNFYDYTIQNRCSITCPCRCIYCRGDDDADIDEGEKTNDSNDFSYPVTPGC